MRKLYLKYMVSATVFCLFISVNGIAQDSTFVPEGTVKVETSESIKNLIAKKRQYNKNKKFTKGFKIQLFYGSEQSAEDVKSKFESVFTDQRCELNFDTPYWKVVLGNYKTRLEAERFLAEVKEGFPSAIIIPAKVRI